MKLQIALDEVTIAQGLDLCERIREYIDIIEIGTPLIMKEGMHAVRSFREKFPEKEILADAKIMDAGEMETIVCLEAGADYVTVLGVTDMLTIKKCAETAEKFGKKAVVDMICVSDINTCIPRLEGAGITDIAVHTGVDRQAAGGTPLEDLKNIKACSKKSLIYAAGGINLKTVDEYKALGADVIIVGSGIVHAENPEDEARAIAEKIH